MENIMEKQNEIITSEDYITRKVTHEEFYGQFVNQSLINHVIRIIGEKRILNSRDEYLNDIPLREWNGITTSHCINRDKWRKAWNHLDPKTFPWLPSDTICVAKAAAQEFRIKNHKEVKRLTKVEKQIIKKRSIDN